MLRYFIELLLYAVELFAHNGLCEDSV